MASGQREEREEEAWEARAGSKEKGNERGMEMECHRQRRLNNQRWSRRGRGGEREKEKKMVGEEEQKPDTMVNRKHTVHHK